MRIGDVATVEKGVKPVYTLVTSNGKPAVLLNINRQPNSNTVSVANAVHDEVAQIQQTLPAGIALTPFYDQSQIVRESIKSVRDAIILGNDSRFHHHGLVPARLGHFNCCRARNPSYGADHSHYSAITRTEFQSDDALVDWRRRSAS